jgi:hypothetical protein
VQVTKVTQYLEHITQNNGDDVEEAGVKSNKDMVAYLETMKKRGSKRAYFRTSTVPTQANGRRTRSAPLRHVPKLDRR